MTTRVRVKICGITSVADALAAAAAGADAIGLVFYAPSPRAVSLDQAADIVAALPAFIATVGLFVDPSREEVAAVLSRLHLSALQFHGSEDAQFAAQFGLPYIKALGVRSSLDIDAQRRQYATAAGLLLDKYDPLHYGGTGETFDWDAIEDLASARQALILAGGLTVENVAAGIAALRPYAVDVSSGVERKPGIKDAGLIEEFIAQTRKI